MKKTISILLSFVLVFLSLQVVFADANSMQNFKETRTYAENQFTDVSTNDWFSENVKKAYELGLVSGTSETTFNPKSDITIAETITLASRLYSTYTGDNHKFESTNPWYQSYIDYAVENGIIKSGAYSDYNAKATRAQFADIFASSLPDEALKEINIIEDNAIADVSITDSYATAIYRLYRAGILTGNDDKGTFEPSTNIQRSAVAAIVSRMAIESMRVSKTLKVEKMKLATLGEFGSRGHIQLAKYNNNLYTFDGPWDVRYSLSDFDPYDYDDDSFEMIFMPHKIRQVENPFVSGQIYFTTYASWMSFDESEKNFSYDYREEYIGATTTLAVFTLEYNGKTFESITAEEYLAAGLKDKDTGYWNVVRFYVDYHSSWTYVCYNLNDLAKYFGINRSFKIDETGEEAAWIFNM